jgi:hypothetical protein
MTALVGLCCLGFAAAGCGGDTTYFVVENRRAAEIVVQPENPIDVPAWVVSEGSFGWTVPTGSVVRVFTDDCDQLWEGVARSGLVTTIYVFHDDGTVTETSGINLMGDPGHAPIEHPVCTLP